jgi:uncharacterized protein YecT (DUF1311 family)
MSRWLIALLLFALNAYAVDEDRVIKEMTRTSNLTAEEIKESYKDGCDSGAHRPMLICGSFAFTSADIELNDLYKKLMRQLTTKSAKDKLISAQKAWIAYRDQSCEYESEGYTGGRDWSSVFVGCKTTATLARIAKLKEYLGCKEPGCPGQW